MRISLPLLMAELVLTLPAAMDFSARTLATLDWDAVRGALVDATRTPMGAERGRALLPLATRSQVLDAYALVAELTAAGQRGEVVPVDAVGDIRDELGRAARGMVIEAWALVSVGRTLAGIGQLHDWLAERESPRLRALTSVIDHNRPAGRQLRDAFDADGTLSDRAFPKLAALREQVQKLRVHVHDTLSALLGDGGWGEMLMDHYVTERNGRLVVPVKMQFRRGLGIVHGTSASGETAYVEPGATVELQNDLRAAEDGLAQETLRILAELSDMVGRIAVPTLAALEATGDLDLAAARSELGFGWQGTVPEVGQSGIVRLRHARHPLLALRGVEVVGNTLELDETRRCLVLTGPNAGGKTVALKTIGLCALCVRAAIPIPVAEGSRLDWFEPILADIGDLQSVASDLSTFSGHLAVLKEALAVAGPGALILVDEVAVGTDPAQGAALAAAVVEALVERDARVVITTHYPELKAVEDPRITVAGMEFADGRPTYRLLPGLATGSQGLVIAQRMGLPASVLERAHTLLDEGAARLARLAESLDAEREAVARTARQLESRDEALRAREADLQTRQDKLDRQLAGERARLLDATRAHLKTMEEELRALVKEVHQAPTLHTANQALAAVRGARFGLDGDGPAAGRPTFRPALDERVWVTTVGQHGQVLSVGADHAEVQVRAMKVRLPLDKLAPAKDKPAPQGPRVQVEVAPSPAPGGPGPEGGGLRLPHNTCDLRGLRLADAEGEVGAFISRLKMHGERYGYLLHGHGTGALKAGLRDWLRTAAGVRNFRAAATDEGGDAFTVVEV